MIRGPSSVSCMRHRFPAYELVTKQLEQSDIRFAAPSGPVLADGNPRVFDGGEMAFREILERIGRASRSIEVRAFLWRDDEAGNALGQALLQAAERGVQIRILKDRIAAVYEYTGGNKQSFFHKRVDPIRGMQAWFLGAVYRARGSFKQRPNPLSAAILGDQLDARREQLRTTLPIRRVVGPADIAALAVHLMTNTAVTGATFDIDGGQQLVES